MKWIHTHTEIRVEVHQIERRHTLPNYLTPNKLTHTHTRIKTKSYPLPHTHNLLTIETSPFQSQ